MDKVPKKIQATVKIFCVIPCYRVGSVLQQLVQDLIEKNFFVIVVNDCCPNDSTKLADQAFNESPQYSAIANQVNLGVGGSFLVGLKLALEAGADYVIKVDGDGQHPITDVMAVATTIEKVNRKNVVVKGNRFAYCVPYNMPLPRLIGNIALTTIGKVSTGFYQLQDIHNGLILMDSSFARFLLNSKIDQRYFFETDLLNWANIAGVKVIEVPTSTIYHDEVSSLSIFKSLFEFPCLHFLSFIRRINHKYFYSGNPLIAVYFYAGFFLVSFSIIFGVSTWLSGMMDGSNASPGTVGLFLVAAVTGLMLLLRFFDEDSNE